MISSYSDPDMTLCLRACVRACVGVCVCVCVLHHPQALSLSPKKPQATSPPNPRVSNVVVQGDLSVAVSLAASSDSSRSFIWYSRPKPCFKF